MNARAAENRSHGLEPEDVDLLFPGPDEEPSNSRPITTPAKMDYKRMASGERPEEIHGPGDKEIQAQGIDEAEIPPMFEDEPWPNEEGESSGPEISHEQATQVLAKDAGHSMIDDTKAPAPPSPERVISEPSPTDRTWRGEIERIFRKDQRQ